MTLVRVCRPDQSETDGWFVEQTFDLNMYEWLLICKLCEWPCHLPQQWTASECSMFYPGLEKAVEIASDGELFASTMVHYDEQDRLVIAPLLETLTTMLDLTMDSDTVLLIE